jgi:hypothetical protein
MYPSLSPKPSLEQLRKQAKDLLKLHKRGDPACCPVLRQLRQLATATDADVLAAEVALNEVQFALAMYYGFEGWAQLKRHVEFVAADARVPKLQRGADGVVIAGLEHMDWGGSFFQRRESFMVCLAAALRAAGKGTSFEEVMGLSGAAFELTIKRPWCPSAASSGVGADCPDRALRAFGCSMEHFPAGGEGGGQMPDATREAIVASIDRGVPALYMDGEFSLVVGYGDGGQTWICKAYPGGKAYRQMTQLEGMLEKAWWVNVIHLGAESPRPQVVRESLETVVELARTPSFGEGTLNGFAAYEAWADDLETLQDRPNLHANAYVYAILLTSRAAAAEYLRAISAEVAGEAAGRLRSAAERYATVSRRLLDGRSCIAQPWEESWTPVNRAREAEIMRANLEDERVAVGELQQALAVLE